MASRFTQVLLWIYPTAVAVNYAVPLGLPGAPYSRLLTVLVALVVAGTVVTHPRRVDGRWTREEIVLLTLLGLMVVWGCVSLLWSPEPFMTLAAVVNVLIAMAAAWAFMILLRRDPRRLVDFAVGWLAATFVICAFAVLERGTGLRVPVSRLEGVQESLDEVAAVSATFFTNPNEMGAFLLVALPSILYLVHVSAGWRRWVAAIGVLAVLAGTALSAARISTFAALAAVALFVLLSSGLALQARIGAFAVLGLTALGAMLAAPALVAKLSTVAQAASGDQQNSRIQLIADGWDLIRLSGGRGIGAGAFNAYDQDPHLTYLGLWAFNPHNVYLELLAEFGVIIGILFVAWLLWLGTRWVMRPELRADRGILLGGWVALALLGLQNSSSANWLVFWLLPISLTLISSDAVRRHHADTSAPETRPLNLTSVRERITP